MRGLISLSFVLAGAAVASAQGTAVVDYLNWIHGDRQIDRDRVVGRLGDDPAPPAEDARYERPELPGAGSDAERWEGTEGTARVVSGDDGPGRSRASTWIWPASTSLGTC